MKKPWINARTTLWYMSFCGFAINYVLRNNLNIAIVGMIKTRNSPANSSIIQSGSECYNNTVLLYTTNLTEIHQQQQHQMDNDNNHLNLNQSVILHGDDNEKVDGGGRGSRTYLLEQQLLDLLNVSALLLKIVGAQEVCVI